MIILKLLLALSAIVRFASAWHVCQDEQFCATLRNRQPSQFSIKRETIKINELEGTITAKLNNQAYSKEYDFTFSSHHDGVIRIVIRDPSRATKPIPSVLLKDIPVSNISTKVDNEAIWIVNSVSNVYIGIDNFWIACLNYVTNEVIWINQEYNLFVEDALALKIKFNNTQHAYGIPEHGERLKLKDTKNAEPYRLFNLDYGYYNVESPEALYGSVPVLYAHGQTFNTSKGHVSGVFWNNPAQTFVNIDHSNNSVTADFITEAGTLDLFVLPGGESFKSAVDNYVKLTGTAPLPQLFAMGYHQSRYSYLTQDDLETVALSLVEDKFPVDVLWLDIDYTDGKKYFTWNYTAFHDPLAMQELLSRQGAKLVTIIDPHIKAEDGYVVFDEMNKGKYYVMNENGTRYEGNCWPGLSSYVDFFNPDALKWWGNLYNYDNFGNTTSRVHIWNDMNEPSVFDVEEKTMDKDIRHYGDILHKEVHNMYGYMQTKGTFEGLLARDNNKQRPFVLTRSHFAGSQRYAAIWTGDNIATWAHLRVSIPICLTEALVGISFCGADVGGFIEYPSDELFQRWYQLGAWYPFFRAHSNNESKRREPFLYPKDIQARFRQAIRQRYAHLPYWYTVWYEHERNGEPVMRPLVYQYPQDKYVPAIDTEFLIGSNILVAPILDEGATTLQYYLPNETWFYHEDPNKINDVSVARGPGNFTMNTNMDTVPVFYRGGSIIPRKDKVRNSTEYMKNDPYNLYCYLKDNTAVGTLYVDDTVSYDYKDKKYDYMELSFYRDQFKGRFIDDDASYEEPITLGSVFMFYDHQMRNNQGNNFSRAVLSYNNLRKEFPVVYNGANMLSIEFNYKMLKNEKEFSFKLV